jgi:hypothetical protein
MQLHRTKVKVSHKHKHYLFVDAAAEVKGFQKIYVLHIVCMYVHNIMLRMYEDTSTSTLYI